MNKTLTEKLYNSTNKQWNSHCKTLVGNDRSLPYSCFHKKNLSKRDLTQFDLSRSMFIDCNLNYCCFNESTLYDCMFVDCNLAFTHFIGANLSNTAFKNNMLMGALFDGSIINWRSHELLSHIISTNCGLYEVQAFCAYLKDRKHLPTKDFVKVALNELKDGSLTEILRALKPYPNKPRLLESFYKGMSYE